MKAAIMQPYFFPYIGYFQLIAAVDLFIVYDDVKYTKKGWINRNRMLVDGAESPFSLPLQKASDALLVREREISPDFEPEKLLNRIREAYRRAPCFAQAFPVVEEIIRYRERNLFRFLRNSIVKTCEALNVRTHVVVSSSVGIAPGLKGQARVVATCRGVGASAYVNPPGGAGLYSKADFAAAGIELSFLEPRPFVYEQHGGGFVPWLSIVDVMMFNPPDAIARVLASGYDLV
jgi:hypothetical protein